MTKHMEILAEGKGELLGQHRMFPTVYLITVTVEVRWFYAGTVPRKVLEWFQQGQQNPGEPTRRVDYYLRLADSDSIALGIKLREGKIEIKQRHRDSGQVNRQYGMVRFHKRATGVVEHWRKWSFELADANNDRANCD